MMHQAELIAALRAAGNPGLSAKQFAGWLRRGLPSRGEGRARQFDPAAVRAWLIEQGLARQREIAKTLGDVARHFKVAERTAAYWRSRGMPGEPGAFDLEEIAAWREREGLVRASEGAAADELARVEVELKQLKLEQARGELVKVEPIRRLFQRHIGEAKTQLEQLGDELLADLGELIPRSRLAETRALVKRRTDAAYQSLADLLAAEEMARGPEADAPDLREGA